MSKRGDVCAIVKLRGGAGEFKGRFKWDFNIEERVALQIVLRQMTQDELRHGVRSVILDPVEPLQWLSVKRVYNIPELATT